MGPVLFYLYVLRGVGLPHFLAHVVFAPLGGVVFDSIPLFQANNPGDVAGVALGVIKSLA